MKAEIHPEYDKTTVTCVCGNSWETRSTAGESLHVDICSACHPFYTGKQKLVDTAGRVERFRKRFEKVEALQKAAEERKAAKTGGKAEPAAGTKDPKK
jgi:large subunit ribosomal protein L31